MQEHAAPDAAIADVLAALVRRSHLVDPSDWAGIVAELATGLGARDVVLYRVDYERTHLVPVPSPTVGDRTMLSVEGSLAGRAFTSSSMVEGEATGQDDADVAAVPAANVCSGRRLWVPLLDGTERIGVMELTFDVPAPADDDRPVHVSPEQRTASALYAGLVADLMISKSAYGDVFEFVRRRRRPSIAAEIQWKLLPPLTVATESVVVSGILEPAYDVAGDSFDYAVNGDTVHLAIFDAMGHGLGSALFATVAVAAYRNARRALDDLPTTYRFIDDVLASHSGAEQFATALLGELDVASGTLRWLNAGHLPPLLLRKGSLVAIPETPPATPVGLGLTVEPPVLGRVQLEPGDRVLLYTDGVVEARTVEGDFFGVDRLVDLLVRQSSSGHHAPEALRRLAKAVLAHQAGELVDDATILLLEWRGDSHLRLLPS